jgi:hypothetical protein
VASITGIAFGATPAVGSMTPPRTSLGLRQTIHSDGDSDVVPGRARNARGLGSDAASEAFLETEVADSLRLDVLAQTERLVDVRAVQQNANTRRGNFPLLQGKEGRPTQTNVATEGRLFKGSGNGFLFPGDLFTEKVPVLQKFPAVEVQRQDLTFDQQRAGDAKPEVDKSEIFSPS